MEFFNYYFSVKIDKSVVHKIESNIHFNIMNRMKRDALIDGWAWSLQKLSKSVKYVENDVWLLQTF